MKTTKAMCFKESIFHKECFSGTLSKFVRTDCINTQYPQFILQKFQKNSVFFSVFFLEKSYSFVKNAFFLFLTSYNLKVFTKRVLFLCLSSKYLTVLYKNSLLFLFLSSKNVKVLHKKVFCFYFYSLKVLQCFRKIVRCFYFCVTLTLSLTGFDLRHMHRSIANSTDLSLSQFYIYQNLFQTIVMCNKVSFVKSKQMFLSLFLAYFFSVIICPFLVTFVFLTEIKLILSLFKKISVYTWNTPFHYNLMISIFYDFPFYLNMTILTPPRSFSLIILDNNSDM